MLKLSRSLVLKTASGRVNQPIYVCMRGVTTHQEEINNDEHDADTPKEEMDDFTQQFLDKRIKISEFQRLLLAAGSSIAALFDPRRHDMIACLGETTGEDALRRTLKVMQSTSEGSDILMQKPRINTKTMNLDELKNLPIDTFGHQYFKFLDDNVNTFLFTN